MKIQKYQIYISILSISIQVVLQLIFEYQDSKLIKLDPLFGLLHRGTEKLIEYKNCLKSIPYLIVVIIQLLNFKITNIYD
jgi:NADH:ubiquinone oxidoreductase subunit D